MQIEISLMADPEAGVTARDLGHLLHKHPDHVHQRETSVGTATVFFSELSETRATAVLHVEVDPLSLVRGKNHQAEGLLAQYVNDRPYAASSFLSVAMGRSFAQTMAGKSKDRQALADRPLAFEIRVRPLALSGGRALLEELFEPLGYQILSPETDGERVVDLRLRARLRLADILNHLYVLIPVMDNFKHYYVAREEIDKLLAKGEGWLATHPAKALITRRALKHRRALAHLALARLDETLPADEDRPRPEEQLERPMRLHDIRLDAVLETLLARNVRSVLDLGCGEGKLMARLIKTQGIERIVGVDPSVRTLEIARRKLRLDQAGEAMAQRVTLQMGSLTYGDRRWQGFDAATLVEVIEHIEPHRLSALALSVFGDARPGLVVVTTPNRDYNTLFEGMAEGQLRHPDHRFEWAREELATWGDAVASEYGYAVSYSPLGPVDVTYGGPSQMAVFQREEVSRA